MHKKKLIIQNAKGLHARAAAKFVKTAEEYDASVVVNGSSESVTGTSIMGLMLLGASKGTSLEIEATGTQALDVIDALEDLFNRKFDEEN